MVNQNMFFNFFLNRFPHETVCVQIVCNRELNINESISLS